jgi:hypothetical protein
MIWILVVAAVAALAYGLWRNDWRGVLASALLYAPFALYLMTGPSYRWPALLGLSMFLAAAAGMRRNGRVFAGLLALPAVALAVYFAWLVAASNPG